ncbi:DUF4430 domain-containing protein [Hazenella coriacea]|uniref:Uncharacterized protein DUF4430 n=1 Tax=Hazenella coriacea TaxID=1179467 RepID=A0A4R3L2F6_9BACL|nr:DUF4430 domain-containing protein [Hazenella coriacea]TCS93821.1 uncharacterized protein DUF4430 [Hazenella coriacea]
MKRWVPLIIALAGLLFVTAGVLSMNEEPSPSSASKVFSQEDSSQTPDLAMNKEKLSEETPSDSTPEKTEQSQTQSDLREKESSSSPKIETPSSVPSGSELKPSAPTLEKPISTVQYYIRGDQQLGVIFSGQVPVHSGDTVFEVLKRVTKQQKIAMEHRGIGSQVYVEGIANLYEFDRGQGSGWMYRVNGVFPNKSAGVFEIKPGDKIEWLYTLDLGKDLGAELK